MAEGKSHTAWYYAPQNKSNLLTELTGSSIAKTAAGLPIQGCVFGAVRSKVNSDWSAKHHQRTINRQETLILVRDISVKYGVIALYGKQIDPGRNALYIYGIKCSTDEKGNTGNELITKKINSNSIQHTHKFSSSAENIVYRVSTSSVAIPLYQCRIRAHQFLLCKTPRGLEELLPSLTANSRQG